MAWFKPLSDTKFFSCIAYDQCLAQFSQPDNNYRVVYMYMYSETCITPPPPPGTNTMSLYTSGLYMQFQ